MKNPSVLLMFVFFFLPFLLFRYPAAAGAINVGSISDRPAAEIRKFLPFASYLAKKLREEGIEQGKVVVARSISEMARLMKEAEVDLFIDSPFPSLAVSRLSGSRFLLRRWKRETAEYHAIFFVKASSNISRLEELKGKIISFEEPYSTTGYFLPKAVLLQARLKLIPKADTSEPVGSREIGYVFSNDDENTMVWVLRDRVAAGVMDNNSYEKRARGNIEALRVIHRTFPVPRHIVSYRATLPESLVIQIREILIKMDQSEEGKRLLRGFEQTAKFDELSEQSLAHLLKLQTFVDAEVGLK